MNWSETFSTLTARGGQSLRSMPMLFIIIRSVLAPLMLWDAWNGQVSFMFLLLLVGCPLLDLFDGVIARRLKVVSARLREWDGRADVWFYACVSASAWLTHSKVLMAYQAPLLMVIGIQCLAWLIDQIKYRRFSNYHTYTGKVWGLALVVATVALFAFGQAGVFLWLAVICGMVNVTEEIVITLLLPQWTHDVPSVVHAWRWRKIQSKDIKSPA